MTTRSGWILQKIAERIAAHLPTSNVVYTDGDGFVDARSDFVLWVDVQNTWHPQFRKVFADHTTHVGLFTHLDKDDPATFRQGWEQLDGVVHMCRRYEKMFLEAGFYPATRMRTIPFGDAAERFPLLPLRVGIAQRGGFEGKGDGFLQAALALLPQDNQDALEILIKGSGWKVSSFPSTLSVEVDEAEGYDSYRSFYDRIDLLLVPSLWEGGPMAVLEALAQGIPVLAADVGWVRDLGIDHRFSPGDKALLAQYLTALTDHRLARRKAVEGITYQTFVERLSGFVKHLKGLPHVPTA